MGVKGSLKDYFEGQSYVDQRVSNKTNISGGYIGGLMTGGVGNTMNIHQTLSPLEAAGVKAIIDEILQQLSDVDRLEELAAAVSGVRDEVESPKATKSSVRAKVVEGISVAGDLSSVAQLAPIVLSVLPRLAQLVAMLPV